MLIQTTLTSMLTWLPSNGQIQILQNIYIFCDLSKVKPFWGVNYPFKTIYSDQICFSAGVHRTSLKMPPIKWSPVDVVQLRCCWSAGLAVLMCASEARRQRGWQPVTATALWENWEPPQPSREPLRESSLPFNSLFVFLTGEFAQLHIPQGILSVVVSWRRKSLRSPWCLRGLFQNRENLKRQTNEFVDLPCRIHSLSHQHGFN